MLDFNKLWHCSATPVSVLLCTAESDWGVKIVDNKDLVFWAASNKDSLFASRPSTDLDSVLLDPAASNTFLAFNVKAIWGIICVTAK